MKVMLRMLLVLALVLVPGLGFAQEESTEPTGPASTDTSNLVQPATGAGSAPVQSDSTGTSSNSAAQTLQQPATGDEVRVFAQGDFAGSGEIDEGSPWGWLTNILLVVLIGGCATAAVLVLRARRPAQQTSK